MYEETKDELYNATVRSIMPYGGQIWVINKKTKEKIRAVKMEYSSPCCRATRTDRIRNEGIRNRLNI